jgi:hypothetical protein
MKTIKIFYAVLTGAILLVMAACNKGENDFVHQSGAAVLNLTGHNGSTQQLVVKIDTVEFTDYIMRANAKIAQSHPYLLKNKTEVSYSITEQSTGKLLLEGKLRKGEIKNINMIYLLGKVIDNMPALPAVEEGKVKMYYMFVPTVTNYTGLVDIEAVRIDNISGAIEKIGRINNVKPFEFSSEPLIFSTFKTGIQEVNGVRQAWNLYLRIYKAGTSEYYTNGTGYTWHENSSNPGKAAAATASSTLYIVGEAPSGTQMRFSTIYSQSN